MTQGLMDSLFEYIEATYSPAQQSEFRAAFMVFDAFDYAKPYEELPDVIYDVNADDQDLTMLTFTATIDRHLDQLLTMHKVAVMDETSMATKNQLLASLYRLQHLEDPVPVLRILETTDLPNEDMLARIVSSISTLDESDVLIAIETVDDQTIQLLQQYLYQQEANQATEKAVDLQDAQQKHLLLENLKDFFVLCGKDNVAYAMVENNILLGNPIALYYPYIYEHLVTANDEQTAKNLLGFFFIASDTFHAPLETFRQYSEDLISDHGRIMRIEVAMGKYLTDLRQYQKAKRDARQLPGAEHQAQAL